MRILEIRDALSGSHALDEGARILQDGGLVAFPTETVYGLGASALLPAAVARIYEAKGRPSWNPLIVHVASIEQARELASEWTPEAERLAQAFWPGPLTIVVEKRPGIPDGVTAGLSTVALRIPAHAVAEALLRRANIPVAAPSANRSTGVSPTRAEHVKAMMGDHVDLILDGGPTLIGIESTVVDVRDGVTLLRPGGVSRVALEEHVAIRDREAAPDGVPRSSPGQMERHYAPGARVVLFDPDDGDIEVAIRREQGSGARVAVFARTRSIDAADLVLDLPRDSSAYAAALYESLHRMDREAVDVVFIEQVPATAEWEAVRDRLRRAST